MRFALILLVLLLAAPAWACPTCDAPAMSALSVDDAWGGYPTLHTRKGPKLELQGLDALGATLMGRTTTPRLRLLVVEDLFAPPTVAAGFSWRALGGVDVHVCGPELSVAWSLP